MRKVCAISRIRAHSNNSLSKYQRKINLKLNISIKFKLIYKLGFSTRFQNTEEFNSDEKYGLLMKNESKISLKRLLVTFVILSFIFSSFAPCFSTAQYNLKFKIRNPTVARLTHTIIISNLGKFAVKDVQLIVPVIRNQTPYHFAVIDRIIPFQNVEFENDSYGNIYISWKINKILPKEKFVAKIEYSALSFSVLFQIDQVENYVKESEIYKTYTQPESYVESNDPLITQTAKDIAGNETNPRIIALKIANFVMETLIYEAQPEEKGAKWALINGRGDCSEYSYLFVALCRACGIPARVQAGFVFHKTNEIMTDGHMWAEYYLENYGWVPVDLTWKYIDYQDNLHFGSLQSFPIKYPYDNFFVEYSMSVGKVVLEASQTVEISKASIGDFESFNLAYLAYNLVSKAETVEKLYFVSKLMGAQFFAPTELKEVEKSFYNFNLNIQWALEKNDERNIQQAQNQVEYASSLVEQIIFKCTVLLTILILTIILVIARLSSKKHKGYENSLTASIIL